MRARGASRSLAYLTRSGSYSTRMSPRGHGFDLGGQWDESQGEPKAPDAPKPMPKDERKRLTDALTTAIMDASTAKADLKVLRWLGSEIQAAVRQGRPEVAVWMARGLCLPHALHWGVEPLAVAAWVRASVMEYGVHFGQTVPESVLDVLDALHRKAEQAHAEVETARRNRKANGGRA